MQGDLFEKGSQRVKEDEDEGEGVQQQEGVKKRSRRGWAHRTTVEPGRDRSSRFLEIGPSKNSLVAISYLLTLQITTAPHKPLPP